MPRLPNILLILTDNQGAWTLGSHGNRDIATPNLDRLAAQGIRFASNYCVSPVCSPSRATWLTGLIPSRHGVHCYLGGEQPSAELGPDAYSTIREFKNLPQTLADSGYECGLSGKWHLGDTLRPQLGFTSWFAKLAGHTASFVNAEVVEGGQTRREERHLTGVIADHAIEFLRRRRDRPFFLYTAFNGPYGLGEWMLNPTRNAFTDHYAGRDLPCFPRGPAHPWVRQTRPFVGNPVAMRAYAAEVSEVDAQVGRLLAALDETGLADDTLVVFTADQGLSGGHHGVWGMSDHTRPMHTFEETMHIPLLMRQPGVIPAGSVFAPRVANYDFLTSILDHIGLDPAVPGSPGVSYAPALRGQPAPPRPVDTFFEFEPVRTIRNDRWKYTQRHPAGPDELYDMANDPGERVNLAPAPEHAATVAEARDRIARFVERYGNPAYDVWRGGTSKAGRVRAEPVKA
ncbi:MAG: sulfatase-like hydrolase/transferase [Planctomycetota bacterium]|nr:sulfatase-like hydrolase/transferase [Planctomycetota bacterium]